MESWISELGLQKSVASARIAVQPQYSYSEALSLGKPYFGRRLSSLQSPPVRYALLASVAKFALKGKKHANILEIGSWAGASTITLGAAICDLGLSEGAIVCVDSWEEYFSGEDIGLHYKAMNAAASTGTIEKLFRHNTRVCTVENLIDIRKGASRQVLPRLKSASFDLVYVDGSHKVEDVSFDVEQAKRLVCVGGIVCGDDLEVERHHVNLDAHKRALGKGADFVTDPKTGVRYHPGVTEIIAEAFDKVWKENGLWCVQHSQEEWIVPDVPLDGMDIPNHLQHAVEIPYGLFKGYEIYGLGDQFVAYPVGSPLWFQNRIVNASLEELILLLDGISATDESFAPEIVGSKYGFNIIRYRGKGWVVAQSAGPVQFSNAEQLLQLVANGQLIETDSIERAKRIVEIRGRARWKGLFRKLRG